MKKKFIIAALVCVALFLTHKLLAETYYYGFILSCGRTEYIASSVELSDKLLLDIHEELEAQYCSDSEQFLEDE